MTISKSKTWYASKTWMCNKHKHNYIQKIDRHTLKPIIHTCTIATENWCQHMMCKCRNPHSKNYQHRLTAFKNTKRQEQWDDGCKVKMRWMEHARKPMAWIKYDNRAALVHEILLADWQTQTWPCLKLYKKPWRNASLQAAATPMRTILVSVAQNKTCTNASFIE